MNISSNQNNILPEDKGVAPPKPPYSITENTASNDLKRVRTLHADLNDAVKRGDASISKMVIAEARKRQGLWNENRGRKFGIGALVLIAVGTIILSGAGYLILGRETEPAPVAVATPFFETEYKKNIDLTGEGQDAAKKIKGAGSDENPIGTFEEFVLVQIVDGKSERLSPKSFIERLELYPPDYLERSLGNDYAIGRFNSAGGGTFILFSIESFERVFAGMLEWENEMPSQFSNIFRFGSVTQKNGWKLKDENVKNIEARSAVDDSGAILMTYAFAPSRDKLIIAENPATLKAVLERILGEIKVVR